jgi:hypothetical protein
MVKNGLELLEQKNFKELMGGFTIMVSFNETFSNLWPH